MRSGKRVRWVIDESKYLGREEIARLKRVCLLMRNQGLCKGRYALVRRWFTVELGLCAGLRVDEMSSLQWKHMIIDDFRSSIVVTGKGDVTRPVLISSDFKKTCHEYLGYQRRFGFGNSPDDYVICNRRDDRISTRVLQREFKHLVSLADLPKQSHIHSLRHTYATFLLLASGNNYRFVQKQLGHASIETTQVYAGLVERENRKSLDRMYKN